MRLPNFVNQIFANIVATAVVAIIAITAVTIGAALASWDWPLVVMAAVGMIAICLVIANQVKQLHGPHEKLTNLPSSKLEGVIRDWVYSEGASVTNAQMTAAHFSMWVTDLNLRSVAIAQMEGRKTHLEIGSSVVFTPEEIELFASVDAVLLEQMIEDIGIGLLQLGVFHSFVGDPIKRITIINERVLIDDTLDSRVLHQNITRVRRAYLLVQILLSRTLRLASLSAPNPDRLGTQLDSEPFGNEEADQGHETGEV